MDIPREEYPRPDFRRRDWLNLNGVWEFEYDRENTGMEKKYFRPEKKYPERILVPFPPESSLSGIGNKDFMVSTWYRRKIKVPESWRKKRIFLHFGAVDFKTQVWSNETLLGTHQGGYTPFSFEITRHLKRGENLITVHAYDDNRTQLQPCGKQSARYHSYGTHYTRMTGIWQTVRLEATGQTFLRSFRIYPDLDEGKVDFAFQVSGRSTVRVEVFAQEEKVGEATVHTTGYAFSSVKLKKVLPWNLHKPFLYKVKFSVFSGETLEDEVESYFGLRKIELEARRILLNGEPIFMRMVLDQGYYPDGLYTAPTEEALKNDIVIARNMGFNGARLHQKVFEPLFLYWADRLGYLVWAEYPNWGVRNQISEESFPVMQQEWTDTLERDFNHPAILGWCPLNETHPTQNDDLVRTLYRVTKKIDPTRPVIDTSGYVHVETDVYDCHDYTQNPEEFRRHFAPFEKGDQAYQHCPDRAAPYQGQPYWVSEYGGIWWNPGQKGTKGWGYGDRPGSRREFLDRYEKLTKVLLGHPQICGFCYTQLYDIEQEVNGLYTYGRKPKFDVELIRKINQQKARIENIVRRSRG